MPNQAATARPQPAALPYKTTEELAAWPLELARPEVPLFTPTPKLPRSPRSMTILRSRWIYGRRIDTEGRTDAIGAFLLACGLPETELRECAHLWAWSTWSRQVDVLASYCVIANRVAEQWSRRASLAEQQERERAHVQAALLEQDLIALFAAVGVSLSVVGELTPAVH